MNIFDRLYKEILNEVGMVAGADPGATISKGFTDLTQGIKNTAEAQMQILTKQSEELKKQLQAVLTQIANLQKNMADQAAKMTTTLTPTSTTQPTRSPVTTSPGSTPGVM